MIIGVDAGQAIHRGGACCLQRQRIDKVENSGITLGGLNDDDLLVFGFLRSAIKKTIFHERREDRADTRMTGLAQPVDDRFLIGI